MADIDDQELEQLRAAAALAQEHATRADAAETALATAQQTAATQLRDVLVAANPHLPPTLITGTNPEELTASVQAATALVGQIRDQAYADLRAAPTAPPPIGFRPPAPASGPRDRPPAAPEGSRGLDRIRWALENQEGK